MEKEQFKYLFKLIVIGNSNTGKSCILHQFIEQKYNRNSNHTIGVEFGSKIVIQDDQPIKLQIWDTAGQERFRSVSRTYYRGSLGVLVTFDLTSQESFSSLAQWMKDAKDLARQDIQVVVLGNKSDLKEARCIDFLDASRFCSEMGVPYLETSAVTGEGVQEAFQLLIKNILNKIEDGSFENSDYRPPNFSGHLEEKKKKESNCYCRN